MNRGLGERSRERRDRRKASEGTGREGQKERDGEKTEGDRKDQRDTVRGQPRATGAESQRTRAKTTQRGGGGGARGRRLNRSLFWRRTEGLSSRPWESGGRARAAAMWTVISRIRAGAARPGRAAPEQKAPLCPRERRGRRVSGQGAPEGRGARGRARVRRMGPLCTWWAGFGVQTRVREESGEARGGKTPQRSELTSLSGRSTGDTDTFY